VALLQQNDSLMYQSVIPISTWGFFQNGCLFRGLSIFNPSFFLSSPSSSYFLFQNLYVSSTSISFFLFTIFLTKLFNRIILCFELLMYFSNPNCPIQERVDIDHLVNKSNIKWVWKKKQKEGQNTSTIEKKKKKKQNQRTLAVNYRPKHAMGT